MAGHATHVFNQLLHLKTMEGNRLEELSDAELTHFFMFDYKVHECPQKTTHPWDDCVYKHPMENARRRNPARFRYQPEACLDYKNTGYCQLGNSCPFAHGVFEINLHPAKYRTQYCTEGAGCKRRVCFFAHSVNELRGADFNYSYNSTEEANLIKETLLQLISEKASEQHVNAAKTRLNVRAGGYPTAPPFDVALLAHQPPAAAIRPPGPHQGRQDRRAQSSGFEAHRAPARGRGTVQAQRRPQATFSSTPPIGPLAGLVHRGPAELPASPFLDFLPPLTAPSRPSMDTSLPDGAISGHSSSSESHNSQWGVGSMINWLNALESGHAMAVGQGFVPIPENAPSKVSSPSSHMPAMCMGSDEDDGPRISMRVRRELGLEPAGKLSPKSALNSPKRGGQPQRGLAFNPMLGPSLGAPIPLASLSEAGLTLNGPPERTLPAIGPRSAAAFGGATHRQHSAPEPTPQSDVGRLKVVAPDGTKMYLEDAVMRHGLLGGLGNGGNTVPQTTEDALAQVNRLFSEFGFTLNNDASAAPSSTHSAEGAQEDDGQSARSGKSTPESHAHQHHYSGLAQKPMPLSLPGTPGRGAERQKPPRTFASNMTSPIQSPSELSPKGRSLDKDRSSHHRTLMTIHSQSLEEEA